MIRKSLPFFLLGLVFTIGLDQAVKYWIMNNMLLGTEIPLFPFLSLYHVRNSGIAFSFFLPFLTGGLLPLHLLSLFSFMALEKC